VWHTVDCEMQIVGDIATARIHRQQFLFAVDLQYNRSASIRFEADVKLNCSITMMAEYLWRLYNRTASQDGKEVDLKPHAYQDPVILLPPSFLQYGNYTMELEVIT
jgi:REJ domain